jgi:putative endonuclease
VYILASRPDGVLYVGATNDLVRRVWEHRTGTVEGFTKTYNIHRLVYFESYGDVRDAIQRERNMKHWRRTWKVELIENENPTWRDLYDEIIG